MAFFKKLFSFEHLFICGVICITLFFAKFPTLYHWFHTPQGYWYPQQTSWYDAWDTNFQVSDIRYGQRKGFLIENTYTTLTHRPVFIYQFYTFLGILNRLFHLNPFVLFHVASLVTSSFLILICYFIAKTFFKDQLFRLSAFVLFVLGGGLGWIHFFPFSGDRKVAGFTMINAFERGSEAITTALLLLTFLFIVQYTKTKKNRYIFWMIISSVLSITLHPPFAALYLVVGILVAVWEYKKRGNLSLFSFPLGHVYLFVLYYLFVLSSLVHNPGFSGLVGQELFHIDTFSLMTGFGILSIFIIFAILFIQDNSEEYILTKIFFSTQLFFLFSPLGFHLYYVKGIHIWGIILGLFAVKYFFQRKDIRISILLVILSVSLITRIHVFYTLMHSSVDNSFFFLTQDEGKALEFMSQLPPDSGVLALYRMGNYIPAFSDTRVFFGHFFQTPQGTEKLNLAKAFYLSQDEKSQKDFLQQNNIQYIYYGLEEAELRKENHLNSENPFPYDTILFQGNSFIIYQVTK